MLDKQTKVDGLNYTWILQNWGQVDLLEVQAKAKGRQGGVYYESP